MGIAHVDRFGGGRRWGLAVIDGEMAVRGEEDLGGCQLGVSEVEGSDIAGAVDRDAVDAPPRQDRDIGGGKERIELAEELVASAREVEAQLIGGVEGAARVVEGDHLTAGIVFQEAEELRLGAELMATEVDVGDTTNVDRCPGATTRGGGFDDGDTLAAVVLVEGFEDANGTRADDDGIEVGHKAE